MPKGNPHPTQTPGFVVGKFARSDAGKVQLSKKNLQVKLDIDCDQAVRKMSDRSAWLRRVIREALVKEGLL
ncbi:MAG: hypothetical protein F6J89_07025 [Symploca sp. SIO1C4]|uniref:Uncharacterized protein n=1 Tax=Symploca sp. SIO1C4 TaxID=2607765 RepID=A0A6B3N6Z4_9CYAN|nr:hypothetical protein [Symploca sp. SIO1C4]